MSIDCFMTRAAYIPLATQNGPVLPLAVVGPPNASNHQCSLRKKQPGANLTFNHRRKGPSTYKRTNFSDCSSKTIELTTDGSRSSLGCEQSNTIAWTQFAETKEYSVYDSECGDMVGQAGEWGSIVSNSRERKTLEWVILGVEAAHDESDDSLSKEAGDLCNIRKGRKNQMVFITTYHGILGTYVVNNKRTDDGTRHVE